MKKLQILTVFIFLFFNFQSCKKDEIGKKTENQENESKISSHNSMESHNNGLDCVSCHKSGGTGEGWFNVAGSVYDSTKTKFLANSTVKLYTQANGGGTLKSTIEVDGKGNFYSTANIDFSNGLYPVVSGATSSNYMSTAITTGNCNSCHNNTVPKIWSK